MNEFLDVSVGYVLFVSLSDCIGDEFNFLMNVVWWNLIAKCIVDLVGKICPKCIFEVFEGFYLMWFCVFLCKEVVVGMGWWSDESCFTVVQFELLVMWVGRIVKSGEVGCCRCRWVGRGSLVWLLSLLMEWEESLMMLFIVIPLWSLVGEYGVWWCALKSPVMISLCMLRSWLKSNVILLSSMSAVVVLGGT